MSLSDSMDRYQAVASALQPGRPRIDPPDRPLWVPEREPLEEVVGFAIPDEIWELWNHDLFSGDEIVPLPVGASILGPEALLSGDFENYAFLHFPVGEQIPILRFFRETRLSLVGRVARYPEIWLGGWFDSQTSCHRYRLTLAGMFDAWSEAIEKRDFVWSRKDRGDIRLSEGLSLNDPPYDPLVRESVSNYSVAPRQVDAEQALAEGAILNENHDVDAFELSVVVLGAERRERWEANVGAYPGEVAT